MPRAPRGVQATWSGNIHSSRLVVEEQASRATYPVAGDARVEAREYLAFQAVGRDWIGGISSEYKREEPVFLNWHTGQEIQERKKSGTTWRGSVDALNQPGLLTRLCPGVHRTVAAFAYEPPFAFVGEPASPLGGKFKDPRSV